MSTLSEGRPVTIHDVAKRAGVAVSSVSRVLGNLPGVSVEMREKVTIASKELGYVPHPAAQSLRSGSTKLVGLVVRDFANPVFGEVINGIEGILSSAGYTLLVTDSGRDALEQTKRITAPSSTRRRHRPSLVRGTNQMACRLARSSRCTHAR